MSRSAPALARRLVKPTYLSHPVYLETFGPEVADICDLAGFAPDPEQQLILDLTFALGSDGKSAAFEVDVVGPRQVMGKTGVLKMMELGWLFVTEERLVVHSAHELDTTAEAFNDLRKLIEETPELARHLDPTIGAKDSPGIIEGNGRWAIHLIGGQRMRYKARTKTGGRGLTGNKIVLDEGFAVTPKHVGSLYPTLAAVPDPQVITASSAGLLESAVLRDKRNRGRKGETTRQVWVEYCDKNPGGCKTKNCDHQRDRKGCALDDEKRWVKFMPALGRRATLETVRALRQAMPPEEFAREFMVWWEDPPNEGEDQVLDTMKWAVMANPLAKKPDRACVVLDVHPLRKSASIGIAADGTEGRTLVMVQAAPGISWVVPSLKKLMAKREITEVALDPKSQASVLMLDLDEAGIEYYKLTSADTGQACSSWIEDVNGVDLKAVAAGDTSSLKLEHVGQPELDTAVPNAKTRCPPGGEIEQWDARDRKIDISPVRATSAAAYRWRGSGQPPRSAYEDNDLLVL